MHQCLWYLSGMGRDGGAGVWDKEPASLNRAEQVEPEHPIIYMQSLTMLNDKYSTIKAKQGS